MWNQAQGLGTPLPVVDSGTRAEEPEDVHIDQYPLPSGEPSHQGRTHFPPRQEGGGGEASQYTRRSRRENLEDSYSGDGDGQTEVPREDLSQYGRNDEMYRTQYSRVNHPHQGLPQTRDNQTQYVAGGSPPTYSSPASSKGITNHRNMYDPRASSGLSSNTPRGSSPNLHRYEGEVLGQYETNTLPYTREAPSHKEGIPQYGDCLPQYHIPRPSLKCNDSECSCQGSKSVDSSKTWPAGRTSMASSNSSTQSGSSGSLLLTAANLAALRCEPGRVDVAPEDSVSLASSTHFTVVNGVDRLKAKPLPTCCWHRHQLTALVLAMSAIFLLIILAAVLYVEMRWRDIRMFR